MTKNMHFKISEILFLENGEISRKNPAKLTMCSHCTVYSAMVLNNFLILFYFCSINYVFAVQCNGFISR